MYHVTDLEAVCELLLQENADCDEFALADTLETISPDCLLKWVWKNSETILSSRNSRQIGTSGWYQDAGCLIDLGLLLYEETRGVTCADISAHSMELWMIDRVGFLAVAHYLADYDQEQCVTEFRLYRKSSAKQINLENFIANLSFCQREVA